MQGFKYAMSWFDCFSTNILFRFYITDFVVKASWSLYCFTSSVSHGVKNYFPRLWGMIIFNATSILFYKKILKSVW